MENRKTILYVKTSLYVLVMLVLFAAVYRLETAHAVEYDTLPAILADAGVASLYHNEKGRYHLRIRPVFGAGQAGFDCREGIHTAFIINRESWYDGGDGWLYCDVLLGPGEAAPPVCLQGYRDSAAVGADVYVHLIFEWQ